MNNQEKLQFIKQTLEECGFCVYEEDGVIELEDDTSYISFFENSEGELSFYGARVK